MTDAVALIFAVLAVVTQVLVGLLLITALASTAFAPAKRLLAEIRATLLGAELWFAWGFALVATLGSLYFSEIANFEPCRLCWFQRICMYPLAVLLLGMAIRKDIRNGFWYAIAFPVVGIGVGLYHEYITYNPDAESESCKQGVSCTVRWIDELGYITMPTLALTAFAAILALLLLARSRDRADQHALDTAHDAD
jgi:disulfide bond formation protein DsbB